MSSSQDRRKVGYLTPRNNALFTAYQKVEGMGDSEMLNHIVNKFFAAIPPQKTMQLLNKAKDPQDLASWPV